jgi:hypothetical protein
MAQDGVFVGLNELLVEILKFVSIGDYDESRQLVDTSKRLLDVALYSRHMHNLTEPILYTQFKESGDRLPKFFGQDSSPTRSCTLMFGSTMGMQLEVSL